MKTRIVFLGAVPLVLLLVAIGSPPAGLAHEANLPPLPLTVWPSEVVALGVALTEQGVPGMALDPQGRPHVVYGHNRLFHAWHDGAAWQVEMVDATGGSLSGPVIAIDDTGVIAIASYQEYSSAGTYLTSYQHVPGGAWQTTRISVPRVIDSTPQLSLALDSTGRPHLIVAEMAFADAASFVYAHASPSGWVSETVTTDHEADGQPALALDSHDRPVVVYGSIETLWLARAGAGGWQHERIAAPLGGIIAGRALALDSHDRAHVIYSDHHNPHLTYVSQTDTGWQAMALANDGTSPSLALDDDDRPHIVHLSSPEGMVYAVYESGGWTETAVPVGENGGSYNTLLLDDTGVAHIASLSYARSLLYATNRGGPWATQLVAKQEKVGTRHTLALDAADKPYLLYYQSSTQQLRWAERAGDDWRTSAVADVVPDGLEFALGMGPDGVARIAYFDGAADELIVGARQAGVWSLEPIAPAGRNLALTVDSANKPHLLVIVDDQVFYWYKKAGEWQSEPVSPDGVEVYFAYLALDSQSRPTVLYGSNGGMKVAVRQAAGDWTTRSLPAINATAFALGPDDALYLLYVRDRTEGIKPPITFVSLWLAEQDGDNWADTLLNEEFYMGDPSIMDGRLLVDAAGQVHLVRRNSLGWIEYHRRNTSGQWEGEGIGRGDGGFDLALGSDGRPRVSNHYDSDLLLHTRDILWLDEHALLPFAGR